MIQLLYALLMAESALAVTLSFASPIRKVVVKGLDMLKQGKGPVITKTVCATMVVVFGSTLYTLTNIQNRVKETGILNPTDELLMLQRLLEVSLMGKYMFLNFLIVLQLASTIIFNIDQKILFFARKAS